MIFLPRILSNIYEKDAKMTKRFTMVKINKCNKYKIFIDKIIDCILKWTKNDKTFHAGYEFHNPVKKTGIKFHMRANKMSSHRGLLTRIISEIIILSKWKISMTYIFR